MSDPTREEIINAHKALEDLKNVAINATDFYSDAVLYTQWKKQILAALPPRPQPTMAETQWNDNKHRLAEAEYVNGGIVIMLAMHKECDEIKCLTTADDSFRIVYLRPDHLIPTGKRYILAEVEV